MSLALYLDALFGAEPSGFMEFREKRPTGMRQHFLQIRDKQTAVQLVARIGSRTDLYVGVAPRKEERGGRDAVENVHVLWADCDTPEAITALDTFSPAPAIVVNSGSGRHAYWPLESATRPDVAEESNRRLAHALGADVKATDAARILRPPSSLNFKSDPPRPVEVVHLDVVIYKVNDVVGELPEVKPSARSLPPRQFAEDNALMAIPATVYVPALTGRPVQLGGKVQCPFHGSGEERTPSLHVYDDPARGWYCFGCCEGGTIIDFGSRLFGIDSRGDDFRQLRQRLEDELITSLRRAA